MRLHPAQPWVYTNLRALDPIDAPEAPQDLIALYTRFQNDALEIRLDFLDFPLEQATDVFLALDTQPGGIDRLPLSENAQLEWDILISIYANNPIQIIDSDEFSLHNLKISVWRDPQIDTITITVRKPFDQAALKSLEVFTTKNESSLVVDHLGPINTSDPLPDRASVLLAFWNTFQGLTPAQALRRWDGAHTGTYSNRHGLRYLLDAIENWELPVFLLDLKNSPNILALDYLGVLPRIQRLQLNGAIILPDNGFQLNAYNGEEAYPYLPPAWASIDLLEKDRKKILAFGLKTSLIIFGNSSEDITVPTHRVNFSANLPKQFTIGKLGLSRWQSKTIAQINLSDYTQLYQPFSSGTFTQQTDTASPEGLIIAARTSLLEAALSNNREIIIIGGDLSSTSWGEPEAAEKTMQWISAHPWINPLNEIDLLALKPQDLANLNPQPSVADYIPMTSQGHPIKSGMTVNQIQKAILNEILLLEPTNITEIIWQTYQSFVSPASPLLAELRASYLGLLGHLLEAANWATYPKETARCDLDLDWDGEIECILSSDNIFATFERDGARLIIAFTRTATGVHQIIAPSEQFVIGLSDPSMWQPERGPAGDPNQTSGGFVHQPGTWEIFQVQAEFNQIQFYSTQTGIRKKFLLTSAGLEVEVQSAEPILLSLPLVLDPWLLSEVGWSDSYDSGFFAEHYFWRSSKGITVGIQSSIDFTVSDFKASQLAIHSPEDPNYDYPPGHTLPFPMTVITFDPTRSLRVTLSP